MHSDYLNPVIRQLRDQQVRFAPREKKIEQVSQAERLLAELDPGRIYPYEYICYRITNYRPESYPDLRLSGQEASHDLRLFVEDVSDAAGVPAEAAGETVLTVEELAKRFSVSTKTISRWRRQGLISRRFVMDGRKRVGFLQSSVDRFVERNQERVQRGSQFSQLTDEERAMITEHARRLARTGGSPADVARLSTGISYLRSEVTIAMITDGTSNTYMLGEKYINPDHYLDGLDGGDNETMYCGYNSDMFRTTWYDGKNAATAYTPMQDTPGWSASDIGNIFGSAHAISCNMSFCDGSVQAINYSIDPETNRRLGNRQDDLPVDPRKL